MSLRRIISRSFADQLPLTSLLKLKRDMKEHATLMLQGTFVVKLYRENNTYLVNHSISRQPLNLQTSFGRIGTRVSGSKLVERL
jgi:hypothetical protein